MVETGREQWPVCSGGQRMAYVGHMGHIAERPMGDPRTPCVLSAPGGWAAAREWGQEGTFSQVGCLSCIGRMGAEERRPIAGIREG